MVNQVDKEATGDIKFPNFLEMMCQKFSDNNAEDEIREAFKVFDNVSICVLTYLCTLLQSPLFYQLTYLCDIEVESLLLEGGPPQL